MIRILIVDDQKTIREGIKVLLANVSDFTVVATANNGLEAIVEVAKLNPDVVLMDIEMPKLNGLKATEIIAHHHKKVKILILTIHDRDDLIAQALNVGAEGYLLKNMSAQQIIRAIRFAFQGYTGIRPSIGVKANPQNFVSNGMAKGSLLKSPLHRRKTNGAYKLLRKPQEISPPVPAVTGVPQSKQSTATGVVARKVAPNSPTLDTASATITSDRQTALSIKHILLLGGLISLSLLVGAIAVSGKLRHQIRVKAPATIQPTGEWRIVQAAIEGKITSIAVEENQQVRSGDIIAQIDNSALKSHQKQLLGNIQQTKQQLVQLDDQISLIDQQISAEQTLQQRNIAQAQAQLRYQERLDQDRLTMIETGVEEAATAVELFREETDRYRELANQGVISQLRFREKEAALQTSIAKLQQAKSRSISRPNEVNILKEKIAQEQAKGDTILAKLNRGQEQLSERKTASQNQLQNFQEELNRLKAELNNTAIRAPISGTIQVLNLRNPEQIVRPGDNIAHIAPIDSPLEIRAVLASPEIVNVEVGHKVKMQVSGCPKTEYNPLSGTVKYISPDFQPSTNSTQGISNSKSDYAISIQPDSLSLNHGDRTCPIKSGVTGKIEIVAREESLLNNMLQKAKLILNVKD